jgi:superfamily II DNA or RNA helicase
VENNSYDVIVLDEVHHAFSTKRLAFIETLRADYIYLLSATMSGAKLEIIEDIFGKFTTSTVTLKDAIKEDILSDPRVYVIGMELDNTALKEEIVIGKSTSYPIVKWEDRMRYIYNNTPCKIKCTEYQKYLYFTQSMDYWKERYQRSSNPFHHNMWVNMGSFRKRYLGEKKTRIIRGLINFIPRNKRFVCFCASVGQANSLNAKNTISSKRSPKLNQHIIDYFNSKLINQIFAVGMITEGMNLTDIEIGIIVQLDGKERLFIQKFGRSMRAKNPVTFIFYYKNTQDEVYLKHALENIDEKFIHHITINQLKTIKV